MNRWLQWYDADHVEGLRTSVAEGPTPKLTEEQREALTVIIELGPIQAGYQSGVLGRMSQDEDTEARSSRSL